MTISITAIAGKIGAARANAIPGREAGSISGGSISGWSIDSRTTNPGDCFFALGGPLKSGHDYVANVVERGAALAIVEWPVDANILQLIVPETLVALQQLARKTRKRWGGTVAGVTGSAGKTTVKVAIASLLNVQLRTGRTIGNCNNHYGVPLPILRLPDDCRAAVIEMGMNHGGEIRELARIAKPQIGVVTNAGWAHAEHFKNGGAYGIEGVALARRELIEELPPNRIGVLNADDERVCEFQNIHPGRSIPFGFSEAAEVPAEDLQLCPGGAFRCLGGDFETPLAGRHGVSYVLAAIAVPRALGIAPERVPEAVRTLATGKIRGERVERGGVTIINDCYHANPEAVRFMLELLRGTPARRRIAVPGEMLELGREVGTLHRDIREFAAEQGIDVLLGIRGAARFMVDGAIEAGLSGSAAYFFDASEAAGEFLRNYVRPGDAILFKGSRFEEVPGETKA